MFQEPKLYNGADSRWDPQVRHGVAMKRIRLAIEKALELPGVEFTEDDLARVAGQMCLPEKPKRKKVDPAKRYRLPSGEVVTGAEVLRRRERKA